MSKVYIVSALMNGISLVPVAVFSNRKTAQAFCDEGNKTDTEHFVYDHKMNACAGMTAKPLWDVSIDSSGSITQRELFAFKSKNISSVWNRGVHVVSSESLESALTEAKHLWANLALLPETIPVRVLDKPAIAAANVGAIVPPNCIQANGNKVIVPEITGEVNGKSMFGERVFERVNEGWKRIR